MRSRLRSSAEVGYETMAQIPGFDATWQLRRGQAVIEAIFVTIFIGVPAIAVAAAFLALCFLPVALLALVIRKAFENRHNVRS